MANYDLLTQLLDLPNVRVTHYQLVGQQRLNLFVESTLAVAVCPDCQQVSLSVHQVGDPQLVRDLPVWNRRCWLRYAPRRFKCETCSTTFVERVVWREPGLDYTIRYEQFIWELSWRCSQTEKRPVWKPGWMTGVPSGVRPSKSVARTCGMPITKRRKRNCRMPARRSTGFM